MFCLDRVEQELLARIVSEINQPAQDPTLKVTQDVSFESEASSVSYEGEDWISKLRSCLFVSAK